MLMAKLICLFYPTVPPLPNTSNFCTKYFAPGQFGWLAALSTEKPRRNAFRVKLTLFPGPVPVFSTSRLLKASKGICSVSSGNSTETLFLHIPEIKKNRQETSFQWFFWRQSENICHRSRVCFLFPKYRDRIPDRLK